MAKSYRSVPLDEEPFLAKEEGLEEKWTGNQGDESIPERLRRLSPYWAWLAHAVLLSISITFFALSFCSKTYKATDADYTRKYSAWCKFAIGLNISVKMNLMLSLAPAASAVKYETQHFDLPPVAEGPFIGKGDDVDAKWDEISASTFREYKPQIQVTRLT